MVMKTKSFLFSLIILVATVIFSIVSNFKSGLFLLIPFIYFSFKKKLVKFN